MRVLLFSDSHLNHANIATYCDRPKDFTDTIIKRWNERVTWEDTVIHLGDVAIGPRGLVEAQIRSLAGKKILIRGNHDRASSCSWWMDHGFDFACDGLMLKNCWLSHEPANSRPGGCELNIHGHLHNIWHGFKIDMERDRELLNPDTSKLLKYPWQRLLACEYTSYYPIEFDEFVSHPDKYQARGKWPKS